MLSWVSELLKIGAEFKWIFSFTTYFTMIIHLLACIWIIIANIDPDPDNSWINGFDREKKSELYLTAFYFTVTTITTVGYGDMPISTFTEKIICIFVMVTGVIGFAMASGALTNYISQMEEKSANYEAKMSVLDRLADIYHVPHEMYRNIKTFLEAKEIEELHATGKFVESLPVTMRRPLSMLVY